MSDSQVVDRVLSKVNGLNAPLGALAEAVGKVTADLVTAMNHLTAIKRNQERTK